MEMQQIRYFLSLARTLNFTRAAEECNVTQPALTRAIQALEAELGGDLLRRERQNSHLTDLGKRMLPLMQRCYESALTAKELAKSVTSSDVAPLAIAVSHTVNLEMFMPVIAELFRSFPGIQLKVLRGGRMDMLGLLKEGGADLAIAGPLDETWDRLDRWPILTEVFEVALHSDHPLAGENNIAPSTLVGEKILFLEGCESRGDVMRRLEIGGDAEGLGHQVMTQHDLLALLDANLGVAIVPAGMATAPSICRKPLNASGLSRTVSVYGVAGRQRSAPAAAILSLIRSADWSSRHAA